MGVEEGKAFPIVNILYHQVVKESGLAHACLPTDIHMSGDVGLYGSPVNEVRANSSHTLVSFFLCGGEMPTRVQEQFITAFHYTPSHSERK